VEETDPPSYSDAVGAQEQEEAQAQEQALYIMPPPPPPPPPVHKAGAKEEMQLWRQAHGLALLDPTTSDKAASNGASNGASDGASDGAASAGLAGSQFVLRCLRIVIKYERICVEKRKP